MVLVVMIYIWFKHWKTRPSGPINKQQSCSNLSLSERRMDKIRTPTLTRSRSLDAQIKDDTIPIMPQKQISLSTLGDDRSKQPSSRSFNSKKPRSFGSVWSASSRRMEAVRLPTLARSRSLDHNLREEKNDSCPIKPSKPQSKQSSIGDVSSSKPPSSRSHNSKKPRSLVSVWSASSRRMEAVRLTTLKRSRSLDQNLREQNNDSCPIKPPKPQSKQSSIGGISFLSQEKNSLTRSQSKSSGSFQNSTTVTASSTKKKDHNRRKTMGKLLQESGRESKEKESNVRRSSLKRVPYGITESSIEPQIGPKKSNMKKQRTKSSEVLWLSNEDLKLRTYASDSYDKKVISRDHEDDTWTPPSCITLVSGPDLVMDLDFISEISGSDSENIGKETFLVSSKASSSSSSEEEGDEVDIILKPSSAQKVVVAKPTVGKSALPTTTAGERSKKETTALNETKKATQNAVKITKKAKNNMKSVSNTGATGSNGNGNNKNTSNVKRLKTTGSAVSSDWSDLHSSSEESDILLDLDIAEYQTGSDSTDGI